MWRGQDVYEWTWCWLVEGFGEISSSISDLCNLNMIIDAVSADCLLSARAFWLRPQQWQLGDPRIRTQTVVQHFNHFPSYHIPREEWTKRTSRHWTALHYRGVMMPKDMTRHCDPKCDVRFTLWKPAYN
ncbi:hypothetical protein QTP86_018966 [Hemibagrus guttatus]|nr:hypothetical protein QTP86_018966 [Hemibagrus guttatus]